MFFEKARIIEINDGLYVTMSIVVYNDISYALANKLDIKENPTDEFSVFIIVNNEYVVVTDINLINQLLPKFQKDLEGDLKSFLDDVN